MAITFAVRGDSLNARYSSSGKTPGKHRRNSSDPALIAVTTEVGCIGSSLIDLSEASISSSATRALSWIGRNNWVATKDWSLNIRCAPQWTGVSPGAIRGLFNLKTSGGFNGYVEAAIKTDGKFEVGMSNDVTSAVPYVTGTYAYSPISNRINDITLAFDGSNCELWIDAVLRDTLVMGAPLYSAARDPLKIDSLFFGTSATRGIASNLKVEEILIWNEKIVPTSVALVSGLGSLSGATRNSFVDVASFEGSGTTIGHSSLG